MAIPTYDELMLLLPRGLADSEVHPLTELMIDYQIGVTPTNNYQLVDVSQDFFDEDS